MDNKSFWLIDFDAAVVAVSYVGHENGKFRVGAVGPQIEYLPNGDSLAVAVDLSLSSSADSINLPEADEPDTAAFILPPFWVGPDGKITPAELKLIETVCKKHRLRPMGFISNDEAIVEEANHVDGFPASFVLVKISAHEMTVSLTYLGKVIERQRKALPEGFEPIYLETALLEFKTESTLPPEIILFGDISTEIVEAVKNFPWIGKKNVETFLHFPDIKTYSTIDLVSIYTHSITSQFQDPVINTRPPEPEEESASVESVDEIATVETEPESESNFTEVTAAELGFSAVNNPPEDLSPIVDEPTENEVTNFVPAPSVEPQIPELTLDSDSIIIPKKPLLDPAPIKEELELPFTAPKIQFTAPKFKLPQFKFPLGKALYLPLLLLPLAVLFFFFFSQADISIFLTPYTFSKQFSVTLDTNATAINVASKIIPVSVKSFDINSSASIPTTGQKTIGDKAKGEIVIFNKLDKTQSLPQGTVLLDDKGNKFLLTSAVQVAPSVANLDLGVINLGQTKIIIAAADIGPEFNIKKDTQLHFKDFPETSFIAKTDQDLSGGTKQQIAAVSAQDKTNLGQQITQLVNSAVNDKLKQEGSSVNGLIKDSTQIQKGHVEYSREVGEQADQLTATVTSSVSVYYLESSKKADVLQAFLASEPGYTDSQIDPDNFTLTLSASKNTGTTLQGSISIQGQATPKIDRASIIKKVAGKRPATANSIIKNSVPRAYKYQITTNFKFLNFLNPLPFLLKNITLEVK